MNRTFSDATQDDLKTLTPIVFVIIIGATIVLLRSVLGTVAIVAVLVFVINTTRGSRAGAAWCSAPPTRGYRLSSW